MNSDDSFIVDLLKKFFDAHKKQLQIFNSIKNHKQKNIVGLTGWESWLKFEFFIFCNKEDIQIELERPIGNCYCDIYLNNRYYLELKRKTHAWALINGITKDCNKYIGVDGKIYFVGICKSEPQIDVSFTNMSFVTCEQVGTSGYYWIIFKKMSPKRG